MPKIEVFGHRGASGLEPENTLLSFRRALELGADGIEFDVHLSKDKVPVVIHDFSVDRTTNGKGLVSDLTFAELKKFDAGKGEKIPMIEEVLELVSGRGKIIFELKAENTEQAVVDAINHFDLHDSAIVSSFWHERVLKVKELDSDIRTGIIFSCSPIDAVEPAVDAEADVLFPRSDFVSRQMIESAHEEGLAVMPWVVNSIEEFRRLSLLEVDAVVSDRPDIISGKIKK